jgi:putative transposase
MNTRDYKVFRSGHWYHVYNRGDNKELVFLDEQDYFNFLKRLKIILGVMPVPNAGRRGALTLKALPVGSFTLAAYCLMPNHFHMLLRQDGIVEVGQLLAKLCTSYARYFNRKYERIGNLFQDTFKAKLVDNDSYLTYLSAYIHNNPNEPGGYLYSSFHDYIGLRQDTICNTTILLAYFKGDQAAYKDFVLGYSAEDEEYIKDLIFDE